MAKATRIRELLDVDVGDPSQVAIATDRPGDGDASQLNLANLLALVAGGGGGNVSYIHTQSVPATVWTVSHNLGRFPSVSVVDSAGTLVFGEVKYLTSNSLTVTFSAAFGGKAYIN